MLEKYSKADLKKIVEIFNLGIDEKTLKKKKEELIKEMMKAGKKDLSEDKIDKKLNKKETLTSEKKTHKMADGTTMSGKKHTKDSKSTRGDSKVVKKGKKKKLFDDPKQPKIKDIYKPKKK
jgi:hypothetical protein